MPDRIEAGSYACAAGITGGSLHLIGPRAEEMLATTNVLAQAGLAIEFTDKGIKVSADQPLKPVAVSTAPYPGFATDMQAQLMAMLCVAEGQSFLEETIFENRYMHVPELRRMGAEVDVHGRSAVVHGPRKLTGAQVMATDLRASMSLVLAGLAAEGETEVLRVYHLDRGYERLEDKLSGVGATIERRGRRLAQYQSRSRNHLVMMYLVPAVTVVPSCMVMMLGAPRWSMLFHTSRVPGSGTMCMPSLGKSVAPPPSGELRNTIAVHVRWPPFFSTSGQ